MKFNTQLLDNRSMKNSYNYRANNHATACTCIYCQTARSLYIRPGEREPCRLQTVAWFQCCVWGLTTPLPNPSSLTFRGYITVPTENMAILYIFSHKIMVLSWNYPDYRLSCTAGLLLVYTCSCPPPYLHSGHVYGANIDALSTKAEEATSRGEQGTFYNITKA